MKKLQKKYTSIFICVFIIIGLIATIFVLDNYIGNNTAYGKYIYDGKIDYSVNLKDDKGISNQNLFVSSTVDNIEVHFDYKYKLDNMEEIKYKYEIISSVISNLDDSNESITEVYKKDTILVNKDYQEIYSDNISIDESIILNYDYYNSIALDYDNSVNIPIKSQMFLKLNLYINNENGEKVYTSNINFPLEKNTFQIFKKIGKESGILYKNDKNEVKQYIIMIISTVVLCLIGIVIYNLLSILKYKKDHYLDFKYKKIMQDYDNIIVEIPEIPKAKNLTLIRVLYFKNIIDIQKELHVPILCHKQEDRIVFLIINDKFAYVYFLNKEKEKI